MSTNINTYEAIEYLESLVAEDTADTKEFRIYANADIDILDDHGNCIGYDIEPKEYDLTLNQLNRLFTENKFYFDTFIVGIMDPDLEI